MSDDHNSSGFGPCEQQAPSSSHQNIGIHRAEPRPQTYCDHYYCMMSLADYLAWIQKDDGSEPPISFSNI
ncbi:hypothetical protein AU252_01750 [Pseudarthrobacter sulfonivorans]|uniref:Uncharacterized protein n=1 Tax=Pseudarthrobacter sulfonivorans TaxID=121292 RepID=A0A0U3QEU7_9MICC|nr:hypothetical protein [Pseudarthrobacter sulfonivorans]ALV40043.1 hypothetical protein AU252_01750 [Pseudarthrobacter sulfonivorans]